MRDSLLVASILIMVVIAGAGVAYLFAWGLK